MAVRQFFVLGILVVQLCMPGCGTSVEDPEGGGIPATLSTNPSLKDTLVGLMNSDQADSTKEIIAHRWAQDSSRWASSTSTKTWSEWARTYLNELLEVNVGLQPEKACDRLGVLIQTGGAHSDSSYLVLADVHRLASKYLNQLGQKDRATEVALRGYDVLVQVGDTVNAQGVGLLNTLAIRHHRPNDPSICLRFLDRSIAIAKAMQDTSLVITQMGRKAGYIPGTDSSTWMGIYREAEDLAAAIHDTIGLSSIMLRRYVDIHNNYGICDLPLIDSAATIIDRYSGRAPELYAAIVGNAITQYEQLHQFRRMEHWIKAIGRKVDAGEKDPGILVTYAKSQAMEQDARKDNQGYLAYAQQAVNISNRTGLSKVNASTSLTAFVILTAAQTAVKDYPGVIHTSEICLADPAFNGFQERTSRTMILQNLANAIGNNGDPSAAIRKLEPLVNEPAVHYDVLHNLVKFHRAVGAIERADSCSRVIIADAENNPSQLATAYRSLSEDRLERGMLAESERFAKKAMVACGAIASGSGTDVVQYAPTEILSRYDPIRQWCRILFRTLSHKQDTATAIQYLLDCDSVFRVHVDTLLRTTRDPESRSGLLDHMTESLDRSIQLQAKRTPIQWETILQLMEQRRDHRWRSTLREEEARLRFGIPDDLWQKEQDLRGLLQTLVRDGNRRAIPPGMPNPELEIRDSLATVTASIAEVAPGYYATLSGLEPIELGILRGSMGPLDRAVMMNWDPNSELFTSVRLDRTELHGSQIALSLKEIQEMSRALRQGIPYDEEKSRQFRMMVFGENQQRAIPGSIVIIPDGPLWDISFDALWSSSSTSPQNGPVIRYATSLSGVNKPFDPSRKYQSEGMIAFAPSYTGGPTDGSAGHALALRELGPLTENITESKEVANLMGGRPIIHDEAHEDMFRDLAPHANLLHLAMHGVIDERSPMRSYLLFYATGSTNTRDGVLTVGDVYDMHLTADMAVLSACQTGIGEQMNGEGVMSIGRAFQYAGVSSIVSSLWKVDDQATKLIMVKFYEKLAEGMGKADALAQAKCWYRGEYPNEPPSKWAAFILIGDNEPVNLKRRSRSTPWMIGGGVAVVAAAALARRRRRRRLAG